MQHLHGAGESSSQSSRLTALSIWWDKQKGLAAKLLVIASVKQIHFEFTYFFLSFGQHNSLNLRRMVREEKNGWGTITGIHQIQDLDDARSTAECNGQSKLEKQEGVVLKELHLSFQAGSNCIWKQGPRTRSKKAMDMSAWPKKEERSVGKRRWWNLMGKNLR